MNCSSTKLRPGRRLVSLGKLNVPKPLNLPSQKSENAGNDPTVHLVPEKGNVWGGQQRNGSSSLDRKEQQVGKCVYVCDNREGAGLELKELSLFVSEF